MYICNHNKPDLLACLFCKPQNVGIYQPDQKIIVLFGKRSDTRHGLNNNSTWDGVYELESLIIRLGVFGKIKIKFVKLFIFEEEF